MVTRQRVLAWRRWRRNRGLMTVAPMVLRLQVLPNPAMVHVVYGVFPTANRHYRGETAIGLGG